MIALILASPLPHHSCIVVWPVVIYHKSSYNLYIMHLYIEKLNIRRAGTCVLKGIRYYIDYSQASLTTMETSVRMLCVIFAYGAN